MDNIDKVVDNLSPAYIKLRDALVKVAVNAKNLEAISQIDFGDIILNDLGGAELAELSALAGLNTIETADATARALARTDVEWYKSNLRNLGNEVKQSLINSILNNETPAQLKASITASAEKKMAQYQIDALLNTVLRTYDRRVFAIQTADDPSSERYYYTGPLDSKTRDVCREYLENQPDEGLTRAEIDANPYGVDFVAGGGFNCRHRFRRVTEGVQELVIEENQ